MSRPLGVIEDIDTVKHIPVGSFWGVKLSLTPFTWLGLPIYAVLGLILNVLHSYANFGERIADALLFAVAVEITIVLHALGHILSGKLINSAMDELIISSTRDITLYYGDQSQYAPYIHIVRSSGGPVFNLIVAGVLNLILLGVAGGPGIALLEQLISTNIFFGVGGLLPIPSVDGEVIWR